MSTFGPSATNKPGDSSDLGTVILNFKNDIEAEKTAMKKVDKTKEDMRKITRPLINLRAALERFGPGAAAIRDKITAVERMATSEDLLPGQYAEILRDLETFQQTLLREEGKGGRRRRRGKKTKKITKRRRYTRRR